MEVEAIFFEEKQVQFSTPNAITASRVLGFWHKEPDTIDWIKTFKPGEIFLDIGANIGLYSLFAASMRGVRVFAFEPEGLNYALLNRNIFLNQLDQQVVAFPLALSDETSFNQLHLSHFIEGGSCHNFKEKIDYKHEKSSPKFSQGCISMSLDEMIQKNFIPFPHHIKIDVDGIEDKIIQGALKTLDNPRLRSVLIELNTNIPAHLDILEIMDKKNFTYSKNLSEAYLCSSGPFKGVGNFIFHKK